MDIYYFSISISKEKYLILKTTIYTLVIQIVFSFLQYPSGIIGVYGHPRIP